MKKLLAMAGVFVFLSSILGLAVNPVNAPSAPPGSSGPSIQADGSPLPLPVPHRNQSGDSFVADGSPLPLPVPHVVERYRG